MIGVTYLALAITGLLWGGIYLLMAEGLNLIYGVMRVVNVAHGDFIVVGGLFAVTLFGTWGLSPLLSFVASGLLLFALGAAVQAGILERLNLGEARGELRTLLATFGLSYMVSNGAFLIWGAQFQSIPFLQGSLPLGALSIPQGLLALAGIALAIALGVQLWLTRTLTGRMVRATAESELGAATCGLDTRRLRVVTFALGSAMAGAAGALTIALIPFQAVSGPLLTVQAFTVIALGGLGNYTGALLAAMLIGLTQVWTSFFFGSSVASAVIYAVFIAVLVFRPQGLLGRAGRI